MLMLHNDSPSGQQGDHFRNQGLHRNGVHACRVALSFLCWSVPPPAQKHPVFACPEQEAIHFLRQSAIAELQYSSLFPNRILLLHQSAIALQDPSGGSEAQDHTD